MLNPKWPLPNGLAMISLSIELDQEIIKIKPLLHQLSSKKSGSFQD